MPKIFKGFVHDESTGQVYNTQGELQRFRFFAYPSFLHPEAVAKVAAVAGEAALAAFMGGSAVVELGDAGYQLRVTSDETSPRVVVFSLGFLADLWMRQNEEAMVSAIQAECAAAKTPK